MTGTPSAFDSSPMDSFRRGDLLFDVTDSGSSDGPVVVLLHGFPQRASSWSAVTAALTEQGYRCLAPNQRGYSDGARPSGRRAYRTAELVEDVLALLDAAGADRVHLVGHDWGANVAWAVAAHHPARLASLSALSVPHPAAFSRALVTSRQAFASWYMAVFQLPVFPELILTGGNDGWRRLATWLRSSGQSAEAAERDARAMAAPGRLRAALNWYRAIPFADPRTAAVTVPVPTLFVWSDGDSAVLRSAADRCADWVTGPFTFEVLIGVSHWIPDEAPTEVASLLLDHLRAHPN